VTHDQLEIQTMIYGHDASYARIVHNPPHTTTLQPKTGIYNANNLQQNHGHARGDGTDNVQAHAENAGAEVRGGKTSGGVG
jgi:hypothetical protein